VRSGCVSCGVCVCVGSPGGVRFVTPPTVIRLLHHCGIQNRQGWQQAVMWYDAMHSHLWRGGDGGRQGMQGRTCISCWLFVCGLRAICCPCGPSSLARSNNVAALANPVVQILSCMALCCVLTVERVLMCGETTGAGLLLCAGARWLWWSLLTGAVA
jgi:hypothetical protein